MIINAAIDEDVQVVGLSVLSGAHNALVPDVIDGLKKAGLKDLLYLVGGIIPEEDFKFLRKKGVHMIFTPGASLEDIIQYIRINAPVRN
jgi:methylmalonyl-CoA mutase C-terminal domain/subunit